MKRGGKRELKREEKREKRKWREKTFGDYLSRSACFVAWLLPSPASSLALVQKSKKVQRELFNYNAAKQNKDKTK